MGMAAVIAAKLVRPREPGVRKRFILSSTIQIQREPVRANTCHSSVLMRYLFGIKIWNATKANFLQQKVGQRCPSRVLVCMCVFLLVCLIIPNTPF